MTCTSIVAYLALFAAVGFLFVFVSLLIGSFLRARMPASEKLETCQCGEPTIGSGFVQFDSRLYAVALLLIVFDVGLAFLFPWATVFGKTTQLMDPNLEKVLAVKSPSGQAGATVGLSEWAETRYRELGIKRPAIPEPRRGVRENTELIETGAGKLALAAMLGIGVFFAVLLVGFAYVWQQGDLDWGRPASSLQSRSVRRVWSPPGPG